MQPIDRKTCVILIALLLLQFQLLPARAHIPSEEASLKVILEAKDQVVEFRITPPVPEPGKTSEIAVGMTNKSTLQPIDVDVMMQVRKLGSNVSDMRRPLGFEEDPTLRPGWHHLPNYIFPSEGKYSIALVLAGQEGELVQTTIEVRESGLLMIALFVLIPIVAFIAILFLYARLRRSRHKQRHRQRNVPSGKVGKETTG